MTEEKPCRHEYVTIFQRRLKGLERRLVATRAYLPIGFKPTDLGHLSEGSYCFCTHCRARLFPRRTAAEKAQARAALAQSKAEIAEEVAAETIQEEDIVQTIHVEELEQEAVDVQDIQSEGVKLADDDESSCELLSE